MHILLHALLYFMRHCTEHKLLALQVRILEENKLNATTQQLQNEATLMFFSIRAVEHIECVRLDWLTHTPVCKIASC